MISQRSISVFALLENGIYRRLWETFLIESWTNVDQGDVEYDVG